MDRLQVGRSTVREALQILATLNLVRPAPGQGTFVRELTAENGDCARGHPRANSSTEFLDGSRTISKHARRSAPSFRSASRLARHRPRLCRASPGIWMIMKWCTKGGAGE